MSSSGSSRTIIIMDDPHEARSGDRLRPGPGDPRQAGEARLDRGRMGVVNAGMAEKGAEARDEEVNDEETAPGGGLRLGGKVIQPDDMVESKKDAVKNYGTTRGKLLAD